ncbi:hypothetical protein ACW4YW_03105 [Methylobacillus pratensis]
MKKFEVMAKAGFYQIMPRLTALRIKDNQPSAAAKTTCSVTKREEEKRPEE